MRVREDVSRENENISSMIGENIAAAAVHPTTGERDGEREGGERSSPGSLGTREESGGAASNHRYAARAVRDSRKWTKAGIRRPFSVSLRDEQSRPITDPCALCEEFGDMGKFSLREMKARRSATDFLSSILKASSLAGSGIAGRSQ